MANKTQGETLINTLIDNGLNKALKVRNIFKYLHDIFFSEVKFESNNQVSNTIIDDPDTYNASTIVQLYFNKIGNKVYVKGLVHNGSGAPINGNICKIVNDEFKRRLLVDLTQLYGYYDNIVSGVMQSIPFALFIDNDNYLRVVNPLPNNVTFTFSGFYFVNDN